MEMSERSVIAVDVLLAIACTSFFYGLLVIEEEEEKKHIVTSYEKAYVLREVEEETQIPIELEAINEVYELANKWRTMDITYQTIELTYIGKYFVTAYCPEECGGSWQTSSGKTCHYETDNREPTTCAIDRRLHAYGEIFSIEGKLYVSEDTGSGVQGAWIDCFVETMDEVRAWDTGYKSVYSVSWNYHQVKGERHEFIRNHLLHRCFSDWSRNWNRD